MPIRLSFFLSLLVLTTLACGFFGGAETRQPPEPISINDEASQRLKDNFYQALQEATSTHESELRITNEEITSLIATELTQTGQLPVSEPQVWFTAGNIYMSSQVQAFGVLSLDSIIVATPIVEDGQMVVRVREAQMGPFDFPDALLQSVTDTVNETIAGILLEADLNITRLEILEGEMFVTGTRNTAESS